MASGADASRRKHRRSPSDDEAEKSSKRHKHKHHHHRHHRHRSKKHVEESKQGGDEITPPSPAIPVAISNRVDDDDDVEEGEILEEEGSGGAGVKAVELSEELTDSKNLGIKRNNNGFVTNHAIDDKFNDEVSFTSDSRAELGEDLVPMIDPDALANDNSGREDQKGDKKWHRVSRSPSKGNHKRISNRDVDTTESDDSNIRGQIKSSSSESIRDKHRKGHSPSRDAYRDEVHARSRSMSRDRVRERSRSCSVMQEETLLKRKRQYDRDENDSDDGRMTRGSRDIEHGSRDSVRNVDWERSISYSRYLEGEERHRSWNSRDRERSRERDMDRERRREVEDEERRRDRDWRRETERERSRDRETDRDRDRRREKQEKSRERSWRREKEQDRIRDREVDMERRQEKERGRSRDRLEELDRKRWKERDVRKDKDAHRFNEKDRGRESDREKNRVRDHDRENERNREKRSDRNRDNQGDSLNFHNSNDNSLNRGADKLNRDQEEQDDFEERIAQKLAEQEDEDLDRIKEESRKRREAILKKYSNQQLQKPNESRSEDAEKADKEPTQGYGQSVPTTNVAPETRGSRVDGVDVYVAETSFSEGKSSLQNGIQASERSSGAAGLGEGSPKSEISDEKYCDDIFGETPVGVRKLGKGDGLPIMRSGLHDNWDDPVGYYCHRWGEVLDDRYEIVAAHGKGVFSTVVRAKDLKAAGFGEPKEVAIKIIRNNELMRKAGDTEVSILKKLAGADPENKRHCVRFLSSFKYRNHLCLVFESLHMNLREVLKKFGRNIGLSLTAVREYSKQLFVALKHLRNCGVLHSDIKPDNMLVNEAKTVLKLCDFGNAMFSGKNEITPYLVSRFYRAPEIILGLTYDHPLDMWSVGCCLYELYTGKVLFPGSTNNEMLRLHMELKGPFPKKMLKKGQFVDQHFDQDLNFHATEEDPVTKKSMKKIMVNIKPKDIGSIVSGSPGEDPKMLANFKDLLDKIFVLDPERRITVHQALAHPFITGK